MIWFLILFLLFGNVLGQKFGSDVSFSGDGLVVLVGAPEENDGGLPGAKPPGAAYIFTRPSTSSSTWTQQQKLSAGDGTDLEADAQFGSSVSLSKNGLVACVGAHRKDERGALDTGAAYIFSRPSTSSSAWTQQQKLTADDGTDLEWTAYFGSSVSLSDDGQVALVGAWGKNDALDHRVHRVGAAYIFSRPSTSSSTWTQQRKLLAGNGADLEEGAEFGRSVSLSGDGLVAVVGAWAKNEASGGLVAAGAAYIFTRPSTSSSNWTQQQKLTAGLYTDLEAHAYFGHSVSLSGDGLTALIGAPGKSVGGLFDAGAAYVFTRPSASSSTWTQQQKLDAGDWGDLKSNTEFGSSVSLTGDGRIALVGAIYAHYKKPGLTGAAYYFSRPPTSSSTSTSSPTWTQLQKIGAEDAPNASRLGWSVSLSSDGSAAVVGAPNFDSGEGRIFIFNDGILQTSLIPSNSTSTTPTASQTQPDPPSQATKPTPTPSLLTRSGENVENMTNAPTNNNDLFNLLLFVGIGVAGLLFILIIVCCIVAFVYVSRRRSSSSSSSSSVRLHSAVGSSSRRRHSRSSSSHMSAPATLCFCIDCKVSCKCFDSHPVEGQCDNCALYVDNQAWKDPAVRPQGCCYNNNGTCGLTATVEGAKKQCVCLDTLACNCNSNFTTCTTCSTIGGYLWGHMEKDKKWDVCCAAPKTPAPSPPPSYPTPEPTWPGNTPVCSQFDCAFGPDDDPTTGMKTCRPKDNAAGCCYTYQQGCHREPPTSNVTGTAYRCCYCDQLGAHDTSCWLIHGAPDQQKKRRKRAADDDEPTLIVSHEPISPCSDCLGNGCSASAGCEYPGATYDPVHFTCCGGVSPPAVVPSSLGPAALGGIIGGAVAVVAAAVIVTAIYSVKKKKSGTFETI